MTMMTFRADDEEAAAARQWARRLGIDKSELLRTALHEHLVRLAAQHEAERYEALPLDDGEQALAAVADWGPAEDWSDWADAPR